MTSVDAVPEPISREAYLILQEALTNALRRCGPVPVDIVVRAQDSRVELFGTVPRR